MDFKSLLGLMFSLSSVAMIASSSVHMATRIFTNNNQALFGGVFLSVGLGLVSFSLLNKFMQYNVFIHDGEITSFVGIGKLGWMRKFAFGRDVLVYMDREKKRQGWKQSFSRNEYKGNIPVILEDGNRVFKFGSAFPPTAKRGIVAKLRASKGIMNKQTANSLQV